MHVIQNSKSIFYEYKRAEVTLEDPPHVGEIQWIKFTRIMYYKYEYYEASETKN